MKLAHRPMMGGYSEEGTGCGCSPSRPRLAVQNVTAHPSMVSVPITLQLYNGLMVHFSAVVMCPSEG